MIMVGMIYGVLMAWILAELMGGWSTGVFLAGSTGVGWMVILGKKVTLWKLRHPRKAWWMAHTGQHLVDAYEGRAVIGRRPPIQYLGPDWDQAWTQDAPQPRLVSQSARGAPLDSVLDQAAGWGRHLYVVVDVPPNLTHGTWKKIDQMRGEVMAVRNGTGGTSRRDFYVVRVNDTTQIVVPIEYCTTIGWS